MLEDKSSATTQPNSFASKLAGLGRQLRVRRALRAGLWALFIGATISLALFLWVWIDHNAFEVWSQFLGLDPLSSRLDLLLLILPPVVLAFSAGIFAATRRISSKTIALWADHAEATGGAVSAALEGQDSLFRAALEKRALEKLSSAKERALSSFRPGYHSLVALVLLVGAWTAFGLKPEPAAPPTAPAKPFSANPLDPLANLPVEPEEALKLARALTGVEQGETAKSFQEIAELTKRLKDGELTQGQALAELNRIEDYLKDADISPETAKMLRELIKNPSQLGEIQKKLGESGGIDPSDALKLLGPVGQALGMAGQGTADLLKNALKSGNPLGRLLGGEEDAVSDAEALLDAKEEAGRQVANLREQVLAPNTPLKHVPSNGGLLKNLQEIAANKKKDGSSVNNSARTTPLITKAGIDEIYKEEDFVSRPNKLPPHLERAAKRYFHSADKD